MFKPLVSSILIVFLVSCGGDSKETSTTSIELNTPIIPVLSSENIAIPDNRAVNDYRVLLIGNSHVASLPSLLKTIISLGLPEKTVHIASAGGIEYLEERLTDATSVSLLTENPWSHVILQAQKYSQSGTVNYSTTPAQIWVQLAKSQNTTPVLFPEHPQKNHESEGQRLHELHLSIAALQASCVAPVGLAWDRALLLQPTLTLHADDGNHAALMGAFLTSLVFYEVITGMSADLLPYIDSIDIEKSTQDFLGQIASATVLDNVACKY
jgi:hypothetical protein